MPYMKLRPEHFLTNRHFLPLIKLKEKNIIFNKSAQSKIHKKLGMTQLWNLIIYIYLL